MRPRLEASSTFASAPLDVRFSGALFFGSSVPIARAPNGSVDAIEAQSFATEHFPNYGFSDVDPGEWFASDDILQYVLQHGLRA